MAWRQGRGAEAYGRALALASTLPWPDEPALREVQAVLGVDPGFRQGDAHALGRTYAWRPGLEARFFRKVARDAREGLHPLATGIRLYLDLVHVHPFMDGNARAATIWLCWALSRAGWPLPDLEAVVRLPKPPGHPRVPALMAAVA
ncbi:MAG: Fic family protein [Myxococcales bacterium]|nr:Fic family protein [Myxococcales bacterium]